MRTEVSLIEKFLQNERKCIKGGLRILEREREKELRID